MRVKYSRTAYSEDNEYDSCEEAARWILGSPAGDSPGDCERTELASALGRVCDLLAESGIDKGKIAAALLGEGGRADV